MFGLPVVILGIPVCAFIVSKVQRLSTHQFDIATAKAVIARHAEWTIAERRVVPVIILVVIAWLLQPLIGPLLPDDALTDGSIAVIGGIALFIIPDGTGRPLLVWKEANRAPWDVIMLFGGGLALAAGMIESGLGVWLGEALSGLSNVPLIVVAIALVALVILITEFASNVATATGIMPVVASLIVVLGVDPILLAMPVAMAASWGFMLPSGTGPNAIAWATGHIALPSILKSGLWLDLAGIPLMIGCIWLVSFVIG